MVCVADDLLVRLQRMQAKQSEKQAGVEEKRERLRREMPEIAGVVDLVRESFGDDVRVSYAEENGFIYGRKQ